MADKKKQAHFYWIKLWEWFMHSDHMKIILRQRNGPLYIVLFLYLCIDTANYNGFFEKRIGDYSIALDAREIYSNYLPYFQNCEEYSFDSIQLALELYKQLGLIHYEQDKLKISNHDKLVGSESSSAERMRRLREKNKILQQKLEASSQSDALPSQSDKNVTPIRELDSKITRNTRNYNQDIKEECVGACAPTHEVEGDIVDENDILKEQLICGAPLFISNNQVNDLYKKLTTDELEHYSRRILGLMAENYTFTTSHYNFILSVWKKERKVKK
ncbi:MAG: phage replisome organizer N-terminal domain-containing protein [Clostridia bacterium]|nr:phage replisome organizer N-terminal domain-containing protein [Clostridia bacterium]